MKRLLLLFVLSAGPCLLSQAQTVGGLWQGKWSSPEGFVFEFVMHIDEFADGHLTGFINWRFVAAPEDNFYYKNREGQEAVEYIEGKGPEPGEVDFEGVRKDDPLFIISLDQYHLRFNETFDAFTGSTGHHGTGLGKMEGVRIGLP